METPNALANFAIISTEGFLITLLSIFVRVVNLIIARPQKNRAKPESKRAKRKEIRYERKSIIFLWITCLADRQAILGSVLHHHPDNIDQLTAQADQGLRFCFTFGYFS